MIINEIVCFKWRFTVIKTQDLNNCKNIKKTFRMHECTYFLYSSSHKHYSNKKIWIKPNIFPSINLSLNNSNCFILDFFTFLFFRLGWWVCYYYTSNKKLDWSQIESTSTPRLHPIPGSQICNDRRGHRRRCHWIRGECRRNPARCD